MRTDFDLVARKTARRRTAPPESVSAAGDPDSVGKPQRVLDAKYVSAKELCTRWACSRPQVDRIAAREHLTRLCLGTGRNGMVRFLVTEIEALEQRRVVQPGATL
jgi:hypothetical protein